MPSLQIKGRQKCQIQSKHKMMAYLRPLALAAVAAAAVAAAVTLEERTTHIIAGHIQYKPPQPASEDIFETPILRITESISTIMVRLWMRLALGSP
jgi:hypothetical protein